jgi:hypothetical protein
MGLAKALVTQFLIIIPQPPHHSCEGRNPLRHRVRRTPRACPFVVSLSNYLLHLSPSSSLILRQAQDEQGWGIMGLARVLVTQFLIIIPPPPRHSCEGRNPKMPLVINLSLAEYMDSSYRWNDGVQEVYGQGVEATESVYG